MNRMMKKRIFVIPFFLFLSSCLFWGKTDNLMISKIDFTNMIEDLDVAGNTLSIMVSNEGLILYNLSDLLTPERLGAAPDIQGEIVLKENILYCGSQVLQIIDISNPLETQTISETIIHNESQSDSMFVEGDYVYIGDFNIVDVSAPEAPAIVSSTPVLTLEDIHVSDNKAYLVNEFGLTIMDVTDKSLPVLRGRLSSPNSKGGAREIELCGNVAYITNWDSDGVGVIDISDIDNPFKVGTIKSDGLLSVRDDSLYLIGFSSIKEFSIVDSAKPLFVAEYNQQSIDLWSGVSCFALNENLIILGINEGEILIMNRPE